MRDLRAQYMAAQTPSARRLASAAVCRAYPLHACSCSDDAAAHAQAIVFFPPHVEDPGYALPAPSHRGTYWDPLGRLLTLCSTFLRWLLHSSIQIMLYIQAIASPGPTAIGGSAPGRSSFS